MLQLILGAGVLAALFYYFCVSPMYYWTRRGIHQTTKVWLFGDYWRFLAGKESLMDMVLRCYNEFPSKRYHGVYQLTTPNLLIKDPELVKQITVKEFDHFMDHKSIVPDGFDPIWNRNLFSLRGKKWRDMRPILSSSFTSSKMKKMFVPISECAEDFVNHFTKKDKEFIEMDLRDAFTRFANDVIATAAFGVKVDSLEDPDNEFYLAGRMCTNFGGIWSRLKFVGFILVPGLLRSLNISFTPQKVNQFFCNLVEKTIKTREEQNIVRPDMIHSLMEARKGVEVKEENIGIDTGFATVKEVDLGGGDATEITNLDITAQAMIFFVAGFESTSTLMCFMCCELALHVDIQTRLRKEIEDTVAICKGDLTYEALLKMKYMDMVVSESLRKLPSSATDRECTKTFTIDPVDPWEKPLCIEKGSAIWIPIAGFHRDSKYYSDPMRFDPERFSDENKGNINPLTYLPFGVGPRNCIGSRFALLETKILFFHLLSNFELIPVEKTSILQKIAKKTFNLMPEEGFHVGLKRLKKQQ